MELRVSLCMIVKNEENVLERCLASVAHLVDEVIIVDTGSTDRTREIARKYTSTIFSFEWINDFSAARNYAAKQATGDWILVLDADEYIDEENYKEFIEGLKRDNGQYDTYGVKILNFTGLYGENLLQNYHDRVYKNNGEILYYRAIHEQLKHINDEALRGSVAELLVFHSGYLNQTVEQKGKSERNKELIDKEMKASKNAFDYFNLGNEYFSLGKYAEALKAYASAYNLKTNHNLSWVSTTVVQIISSLIQLKRYNDAINVINDSIKLYPGASELIALKGEICFLRGQLDDAKYYFKHIISNANEYGHTILRPDLKEQMPHRRLGDIYLNEKLYDKAIFHYVSVLNINKIDFESIRKVIFILDKFHTENQIVEFIKTNGLVNQRNIQYYIRACFEIGKPNIMKQSVVESNDEKLLEIISLKNYCVNGSGKKSNFKELLNVSIIEMLNKRQLINIIDLFLFREKEKESLASIIHQLEQDQQFRILIKLLEGKQENIEFEDDLFIGALQILLNYKKYDLVSLLLANIGNSNQKLIAEVAAILFYHEFKAEALQLYSRCDWGYYTEQDYLNVIQGLIEAEDIDNAIKITEYALSLFEGDFRFYKILLENNIEEPYFQDLVKKAQEVFKDSLFLEKYLL
ncbi:glycosyltransferase [Niallia taxi]|uniref:glycosyltransferase n=1 Tax=Niallia taxi TaxID=2499688 RepID=UPI00317727C8